MVRRLETGKSRLHCAHELLACQFPEIRAHDRVKSVPFCMLICALQVRKLSGRLIQLQQFWMVLRCSAKLIKLAV